MVGFTNIFNKNYMIIFALLTTLAVASEILSPDSLAVTIYNDGFGIVKDVRNIKFDQGQSTLYFTDVSSNIQTETVTFKALNNPQSIRVYEQNFEKNLISQEAVMQKYIQKKVDIVADFGNQAKRVSGILLSHSPNFILKTDRGVIIVNKISAIDLAEIPDGFFTVPTLNWKVFSEVAQNTKCEVAYRTTGFQWKADYIITINEAETKADIGGWVTIDNNSGKKYENAKLKLIAGDVNVVKPNNSYYPMYPMPTAAPGMNTITGAPSFSEKQFADYHMYTLSDPVTLNQSSQKQVQFIPKVYNVTLRKYHQITINAGGYNQNNLKASNKIKFTNSKQVGLGIPFPKGIFRVFKQDTADKSLEFIGQDSIEHTPKNENITLTTGNAFDITGDLYAQNRQTYSGSGYRADMNLTITNHKQIPAEVQVLINTYYGDNLALRWDSTNTAKLEKQSAGQYKIVQVLQPDQKVTYKWTQDYQV